MTYHVVHVPFTTLEAMIVSDTGLDRDEARAALRARALRIEDRYDVDVNWLDDDSYEVVDDDAVMVGDYQGTTMIVADKEES